MESAVTPRTAVKECREPHELFSEMTVTKYENTCTAY